MAQSIGNPPLRVLQLTDPHLMARAGGALLGVNTRDSLDAVIRQACKVVPEPDLILATGDLAQDASEEAYNLFADRLAIFGCESAWIPGNHDDRVTLQAVAATHGSDHRHLVRGGWQILLLDSSVPGKVHGELADTELAFLERTLAANPDLPALVTLHHHPVDVGADWMSAIGLHNDAAFWHILDRFPQVKVVLWGHIHQELDRMRGEVRLLATPSTCIQFASGATTFAVEEKAPGFRWLDLYPDGRMDTAVVRATDFRFNLDTDSEGY